MIHRLTISFLICLSFTINSLAQVNNKQKDQVESILIASGQISPSNKIVYQHCQFDLVVNELVDTIYLQTKDTNFVTPEGFRVGTELLSISELLQTEMERMPGWGYYLTLPSGWQLGFCEGLSCTDKVPVAASAVKWIFRRNTIVK